MSPAQHGGRAAVLPCDREPIHQPGSVQDFALVMALDRAGRVAQVSNNVLPRLGLTPQQACGRRFVELFCLADGGPEGQLAAELARAAAQGKTGRWLQLRAVVGAGAGAGAGLGGDGAHAWEAHLHAHAGVIIVELEPDAGSGAARAAMGAIRTALAGLQEASGSAQLFAAMAHEVRQLTGFDRALVYRFDPQWHGEVVAQAGGEGRPSFMGHHFPASDIPPQAREVFRQNWLRIIPDVARPSAALVPELHPDSGLPLDLGHATWRSPAGVHLTYLRNMEVCASLTLSIICQGRLWGLVACHHFSPRHLAAPWRLAAELVGRQSSALLGRALVDDQADAKRALAAAQLSLAAQMRAAASLPDGLMGGPVTLQAMAAEAGGAAAGVALLYQGAWHTLGEVPPVGLRDPLVAWLREHHGDQEIWRCDSLGRHFPPAAGHADVASGLMALVIDTPQPTAVLWFRPEAVREIAWAGEPGGAGAKEVGLDVAPGAGRISPRRSFEAWRQVVRGTSRPFGGAHAAAAAQLRHSITEVDLMCQVQAAQRAARAREFFVGMVSHDLRNPLNVIGLTCDRELRRLAREGGPPPRWQGALQTLIRAKDNMEQLVGDVLDASKIEGSNIPVQPAPAACAELLMECQASLAPLAQAKGIVLAVAGGADGDAPPVLCDRPRMLQVMGNLVSNALKFTPTGGRVELRASPRAGAWTFAVADTGPGIPAEHLSHIFETFWQGGGRRHGGAGLGLAIARGIVEAHGGQIWAESPEGGGAAIRFTLPAAG